MNLRNQVFISYRQESPEHNRAVRRLGELLRASKIPVVLDQFYQEEQRGGPNQGWPKWCEDHATQSRCVLIVASDGWFAAYEKESPGQGFGAAAEADLFRQSLYDDLGENTRIRMVFLHEIDPAKIPLRLRPWHQFRLEQDRDLDQLVGWLADSLGVSNVEQPAVRWPIATEFIPDIADRKDKEWPAIIDLLTGKAAQRIILLEGGSGVGKSELLRHAALYAKKVGIPVAWVDFRAVGSKTEDLLGQIDLEIGELLPNFRREGANKTHVLRRDLRALRRPVLLIFDTYEKAENNISLADWLNLQLLAEVETAPWLAVIVAGWTVPKLAGANWRDHARPLSLNPITELEPWKEWVERRYPGFSDKGHHLPTVLKLAGGYPSVMANYCASLAKG